MKGQAWSAEDKQSFADRNILKAQTIPDKRKKQNRLACRRKKNGFLHS
jgi:hypothetical protein